MKFLSVECVFSFGFGVLEAFKRAQRSGSSSLASKQSKTFICNKKKNELIYASLQYDYYLYVQTVKFDRILPTTPSHSLSDVKQPFGWQKYSPFLHCVVQCSSSKKSPHWLIPKMG